MNRYVLIGMVVVALLVVVGAAQAQHIDSFFDVFTELTAGPPYPTTPPVQVLVSHEKEAGMAPTELIGMSLKGTTNNLPAQIHAYDLGGGGGGGGGAAVESFFDIYTELSIPDDFPVDSFFDVFLEISPPEPGMDSPVLAAPPDVFHVDSFFDIFFEVSVPGGLENLHLHGAVAPGQPLSFFDVYVDNDCDSFFDIFVELSCDVPPMLGMPLFTMTMTGTFVPEPATVVLLMLGGVGVLAISRRAKR